MPKEFLQNKDVFVRKDSVDGIHDLPELLIGDEMVFELYKKPHPRDITPAGLKPSANKALPLTFCVPRNWNDVQEYISTIKDKVKESDGETVNSVMCCDAIWHFFFNVKCTNLEIHQYFLKELLSFIFFLSSSGSMDNFPTRLKEIYYLIGHKNLLSMINDKEDRDLLEIEYVRQYTTFDPSLINEFLPILHRIEAGSASPGASLFYDLLLKIAKVTDLSDWKSLNDIPTIAELSGDPLENVQYLKPVLLDKGYKDTNEYLEVYYRLLRAETFSAIQKGIKEYKCGELDDRDMSVYSMVTVVDITLSNTSMLVYLQFTAKNAAKSWKTSRKLMYGNLLCISINGDFTDAIWMTVTDRDEELLEKHQVVGVELISFTGEIRNANILKNLLYHSGKMVMVESPTYFKSFQHILESLKDSQIKDFKLVQEIVHGRHKEQDTFCQEKFEKRWTNYLKDINYDQFEESQKKSFWHALINPLAIIQGPPGTGKTFIGSKLLHFLHATQRFGILDEFYPKDSDSCSEQSEDDNLFNVNERCEAPILIMTFKNHALDELLKHCLQFCDNEYITRIGRQSKEADLKKCLLFEKMKDVKFKRVPTGHLFKKVEKLFEEFEVLLEKLDQMKVFDLSRFLEQMNDHQCKFFVSDALIKYMPATDALIDYISTWKDSVDFKNDLTNHVLSLKSDEDLFDSDSEKNLIAVHLNDSFVGQWLPSKNKLKELTAFNKRSTTLFTNIDSEIFVGHEGEIINVATADLEEDDEEEVREQMNLRTSAVDSRFSTNIQSESAKAKNIDKRVCKMKENRKFIQENFCLTDFPEDYVGDENVLFKKDLWKLSEIEKYHIIFIYLSSGFEKVIEGMDRILEAINSLQRQKKVADEKNKVRVLKTQKIVGATITGASIQRSVIQKLAPKIVLIEEAAEVLEASLVAVLSTSVEKLILIGDHQQLKAQVDTYHLHQEYNFHISMMERLVKIKFPFERLLKQGRMRPEFSIMLKDIYPDYQDFDGLEEKNHPIKCMPVTSFFWTHDFPEEKERSVKNHGEANMVVALALFFVASNVDESNITILCSYRGQLQTIRRLYRDLNPRDDTKSMINIRTIDEYQGDENEFIIVSLTRSNRNKNIGFLKDIERRCVAQSRAKCGMYFVGNDSMFRNNATWIFFMNSMKAKKLINTTLPICCYKHPKDVRNVVQSVNINASDFRDESQLMYFVQSKYGWCKEICNKLFACGIEEHRCKRTCTPKHNDEKCMAEIPFSFISCGHDTMQNCFMSEADMKCPVEKTGKLNCGHDKIASCHDWTYDKQSLSCSEMCSQSYDCEKKHGCSKLCTSVHSHSAKDCPVLVKFEIPSCKHVAHERKICSSPIPKNVKCNSLVYYTKEVCGHELERLCSEKEKEKCTHSCQKIRSDCGHSCKYMCYKSCLLNECDLCKKEYEIVLNKAKLYATSQLTLCIKEANLSDFTLLNINNDSVEYQTLADKCSNFFNLHSNSVVNQINGAWKVLCPTSSKKFWNFAANKAHGSVQEEVFNLSLGFFKVNEICDSSVIYNKLASDNRFEFTKYASGLLTTISKRFTVIVSDVILGDSMDQSQITEHQKTRGDSNVLPSVLLDGCDRDSVIDKKAGKPTSYFIYDQHQIDIKYIVHLETSRKVKSSLKNFEDGEHLYNLASFDLQDVNNPICHDINKAVALYTGDCLSRPSYHQSLTPLKAIQYVGIAVNQAASEKYELTKNNLKKTLTIDSEIFAYHSTSRENVPNIIKNNLNPGDLPVYGKKYGDGCYFTEHPQFSFNFKPNCMFIFKVLLVNDMYKRVTPEGKGFYQQLVIEDTSFFIPMYVLYF